MTCGKIPGQAVKPKLPTSSESVETATVMTIEHSAKPIQPNAQQQYTVTAADLPLSCPMPGMQLWNSHPKVFLPVEKTGWAKCPYCSAEYTLKKQ